MKKLVLLTVLIFFIGALLNANVTFFKDQRSDLNYDRGKVTELIYQLFDFGTNSRIREIRVADLNQIDRNYRFMLVGLHQDTYSVEDYELIVDPDTYRLVKLNANYDHTMDEPESDWRDRACPDETIQFVVSTMETSISSAVECVDTNYTVITNKGYKAVKLLGNQETNTNIKNYLSCPNLKGWIRVGHGMTSYLVLYDGNLSYTYFQGLPSNYLNCKIIYANSCQAHNSPFEPAVMNAGAQMFVAGNVDLWIGTSEKVCKCWVVATINNNAKFCSQVTSCEQSTGYQVGDHGCTQGTGQPDNFGTPCGSTADPLANFTFSSNGLTATFTDASTPFGNISKWAWNFGNNTTSTAQNPSCTYSASGSYTVTLTIIDKASKTSSTSKTVTVSNQISYCASASTNFSAFHINNVKLGTLNNSSQGSTYTDFTSVAAPQLQLGQNYNLTITITTAQYTNWFKAYIDYNRDGDFDDAGEVIYVIPQAQKVASAGGTITIPTNATPGLTRMRIQVKNIQNQLPAPQPCETFTYGEVEDYTVNIIQSNTNNPPTANFTFTTNQLTATCTDTSTDAEGAIKSWAWNFGDGSTSTLKNPSRTYNSAGSYNVTLTVTDQGNLTNSITKTVTVSDTSNNSKDDCIAYFSDTTTKGIWKRNSDTKAWTKLNDQVPNVIVMGDINGDGIEDLVASFSTGVWWMNSLDNVWTSLHKDQASKLSCGDIDGDGKDDLIGVWPNIADTWFRYTSSGTWESISKSKAILVTAGKTR
jgi:PKD repeat protein